MSWTFRGLKVKSKNTISGVWRRRDAIFFLFPALHCAFESITILPRSVKSSVRNTSRLPSSLSSLLNQGQEPKSTAVTTRSSGVFWSHLVKQDVAIVRHAHTLAGREAPSHALTRQTWDWLRTIAIGPEHIILVMPNTPSGC